MYKNHAKSLASIVSFLNGEFILEWNLFSTPSNSWSKIDNSWKNIHSGNYFIVGERNKLFHSFIPFMSENWYSTCLRWLGQQKTKRSQQYHQKQPHLPNVWSPNDKWFQKWGRFYKQLNISSGAFKKTALPHYLKILMLSKT